MADLAIRPYRSNDLLRLREGRHPASIQSLFDSPLIAAALEASKRIGFAWSGEIGDELVGIAALGEKWPGTAVGWAWFSPAIPKRCWLRICAFSQTELARAHARGFTRIEASSQADFGPAFRFLLALGFGLETPRPARAYGPDGADYFLWAKVAGSKVARETTAREMAA